MIAGTISLVVFGGLMVFLRGWLRKEPALSPGANLGVDVKKTRERTGHSIGDVSDRTGIDATTIMDIENGKRQRPRAKTVRKLRGYIADPDHHQYK